MSKSNVAIEEESLRKLLLGFAVEAQKQLASSIYEPKKKVLVLAGPTGCGKTAFSLPLAQKLGGEVISADSMQIYQGMNIGTAKATAKEREKVAHHLLDIRSVTDSFNVVDFYFEARHCCQVVLIKNKVPIVVGGSGFYLHSLIYGPPDGPPSINDLRTSLEQEIEDKGAELLYSRLLELDPVYAATITRRDKQKIARALEIISLTGKRVSELKWKKKQTPQHYDFRCWFLYRPRKVLYERIEKRCEQMVQAGLLDEVEQLLKEGLLENNSAAQAIGYRQAIDYLRSPQKSCDYEQFIEDFKKASRRYAKRQLTWFRQEKLFRWLDLELHDAETAIDMILDDFENH